MKQQSGFQRGNREAAKRKRFAGGRPTNEERVAKKQAAEQARERIEAEVDIVVSEYLRLAKGGKVKKGSSPQTIRHCVERWLPPARQAMDITTGTPEEFYRAIEAEKRSREQK
jgi:DNA invertase Pin-like site-specific DNA recombinase